MLLGLLIDLYDSHSRQMFSWGFCYKLSAGNVLQMNVLVLDCA